MDLPTLLRNFKPQNPTSVPVRVIYDFVAESSNELSVKKDQRLTLLYELNGWAFGRTSDGRKGYVPLRFCKHVLLSTDPNAFVKSPKRDVLLYQNVSDASELKKPNAAQAPHSRSCCCDCQCHSAAKKSFSRQKVEKLQLIPRNVVGETVDKNELCRKFVEEVTADQSEDGSSQQSLTSEDDGISMSMSSDTSSIELSRFGNIRAVVAVGRPGSATRSSYLSSSDTSQKLKSYLGSLSSSTPTSDTPNSFGSSVQFQSPAVSAVEASQETITPTSTLSRSLNDAQMTDSTATIRDDSVKSAYTLHNYNPAKSTDISALNLETETLYQNVAEQSTQPASLEISPKAVSMHCLKDPILNPIMSSTPQPISTPSQQPRPQSTPITSSTSQNDSPGQTKLFSKVFVSYDKDPHRSTERSERTRTKSTGLVTIKELLTAKTGQSRRAARSRTVSETAPNYENVADMIPHTAATARYTEIIIADPVSSPATCPDSPSRSVPTASRHSASPSPLPVKPSSAVRATPPNRRSSNSSQIDIPAGQEVLSAVESGRRIPAPRNDLNASTLITESQPKGMSTAIDRFPAQCQATDAYVQKAQDLCGSASPQAPLARRASQDDYLNPSTHLTRHTQPTVLANSGGIYVKQSQKHATSDKSILRQSRPVQGRRETGPPLSSSTSPFGRNSIQEAPELTAAVQPEQRARSQSQERSKAVKRHCAVGLNASKSVVDLSKLPKSVLKSSASSGFNKKSVRFALLTDSEDDDREPTKFRDADAELNQTFRYADEQGAIILQTQV